MLRTKIFSPVSSTKCNSFFTLSKFIEHIPLDRRKEKEALNFNQTRFNSVKQNNYFSNPNEIIKTNNSLKSQYFQNQYQEQQSYYQCQEQSQLQYQSIQNVSYFPNIQQCPIQNINQEQYQNQEQLNVNLVNQYTSCETYQTIQLNQTQQSINNSYDGSFQDQSYCGSNYSLNNTKEQDVDIDPSILLTQSYDPSIFKLQSSSDSQIQHNLPSQNDLLSIPSSFTKESKNLKKDILGLSLDQRHTKKLEYFNEIRNQIPELQRNLSIAYAKLESYDRIIETSLSNDFNKKGNNNQNVDINKYILARTNLHAEIDVLNHKIEEALDEDEEMEYMSRNVNVLVKYYNIDKYLSSLNNKLSDIPQTQINNRQSLVYTIPQRHNSKSYFKALLFTEWKEINDTSYICKSKNSTCECGGTLENYYNDGQIVCSVCGKNYGTISVVFNKTSKTDTDEILQTLYKRINHFFELMYQLQGLEQTDTTDIIDHVINYMNRRGISRESLTFFSLKKILRKLRQFRWYEHTAHILKDINGTEPPKFTLTELNNIKNAFADMQIPFEMYKKPERKNLLNYSYVIHKICQFLGYNHHLIYFPLLRNPGKLLEHDRMWSKICAYRGWPFVRSI